MIEKLFKRNLQNFVPYTVPKLDYEIKLDANESFLKLDDYMMGKILNKIKDVEFNRYPDAGAEKVCRAYSKYVGINRENIMAGNGSDELIQIIIAALVDKNENIMTVEPDFSMYGNYSEVGGGKALIFQLDEEFNLDVDKLIESVNVEKVKVLFLSNPNNPTGKVLKREQIFKILNGCNCAVVVDEAYVEFHEESIVDSIYEYENLIVLRTCSKAMASAAIRLGFLITNSFMLNEIKKAKPPFNVSSVTQAIGETVLKETEYIKKSLENIKNERSFLIDKLSAFKDFKLYPTCANFILIKFKDAEFVYKYLLKNKIVVRNYKQGRLKDFLRITVGSREENEAVINNLSKILK
ncbi:histidinol-phosphate transaminase [Clostridium kluyveri]|uniref:Histidinol-phosphate aminotransferase n=1 Tax=Clostridium kluyveri TaxID=1534 RepID=A0A1L5F6N7_CLOKL|nr:histidinol-phosphate transaminase [Clostridium kluyveri]APM38675.1 histidinol-phosphate transaminase [Clostridium kluyveri]UZQ50990.1 histidinol-phosphate transaminase [Clostridium kluyveri]